MAEKKMILDSSIMFRILADKYKHLQGKVDQWLVLAAI